MVVRKAHPLELHTTVVAADRRHSFAIVADALGLHSERMFTLRPRPMASAPLLSAMKLRSGPLP